ncbi:TniQ protein [Variovorax sp. YR266]|uniref:TniQ family protein n=1 Tax=Variovorax sp. YR266 TaxID=1884386 RepID=UPI00089B26C6|nr:TniQ family protein [Variovorax sp. YR266]SDY32751.1 TniQ protein [Variovorax sp. YR266]
MLAVLKILPNEFAPAYIKALFRFNHPRPPRYRDLHVPWSLRKWYVGNCSIGDLSLLGGVPLRDLLKEHTLLHFFNDLALSKHQRGESVDDSTIASSPVMHLPRQQAFLCPCCVENDIDRFGRSYWHADHQLPGIYECPTHEGASLRAVDNWDHQEFWFSPGEIQLESFVQPGWLEWMRHDVIHCYEAIAFFMARWEGNLNRHDLVPLFRSRLSKFGVRSDLPHFVMSKYPDAWLESLIASWNKTVTSPRYGLTALSNTFGINRARRVFVCVVAAVLWPTPTEGIAALTALDITD